MNLFIGILLAAMGLVVFLGLYSDTQTAEQKKVTMIGLIFCSMTFATTATLFVTTHVLPIF